MWIHKYMYMHACTCYMYTPCYIHVYVLFMCTMCDWYIHQLWLNSLEILSLLLAAVVHDVDHPGTTNTFQIKTLLVHTYSVLYSSPFVIVYTLYVYNCRSDFALCYNDRSVLENHHLQYAFQLMKHVS